MTDDGRPQNEIWIVPKGDDFREGLFNLVMKGEIVDSGERRNGYVVWVTPEYAKSTPQQQLATRLMVMQRWHDYKNNQKKPKA